MGRQKAHDEKDSNKTSSWLLGLVCSSVERSLKLPDVSNCYPATVPTSKRRWVYQGVWGKAPRRFSFGDFGDFRDIGVSSTATVAGRHTRWGGPVFPFGRAGPYLFRYEDHCTSYAKPPHSRTRISVAPFWERLPGCNPNWGRVRQCKGGK